MIILVIRRFRRPKDEGLIMHANNIMQKELILQYAYIFYIQRDLLQTLRTTKHFPHMLPGSVPQYKVTLPLSASSLRICKLPTHFITINQIPQASKNQHLNFHMKAFVTMSMYITQPPRLIHISFLF